MLKRLYIDNYKCCVNLDLDFRAINLFLGENGTGKSTIFDVLYRLKSLVNHDADVASLFPVNTLTRWQTLASQHFEVEIEGNGGIYKYLLTIEHDQAKQLTQIRAEKLWFDQHLLLDFEQGVVQLYHDSYAPGPEYPFDWNRSAVGALLPRDDNVRIVWFRKRLARLLIVQITPAMMGNESEREATWLKPHAQNFVSWYRHISQHQGKAFEITQELQEILDGFNYFEFENVGETQRLLNAYFEKTPYRFTELSDGQRVLIVLYTLLLFAREQDYTLCIDEPGNYISLAEIQPWLMRLYDGCEDGELQALLISHHPELINYLASSVGVWFERERNGLTRASSISIGNNTNGTNDTNGLTIAELVARGWLRE